MSGEGVQYFIMDENCPTPMQLWDADPIGSGAGQEWIEGHLFDTQPDEPFRIKIVEGDEKKTQLDYFGDPVVSNRFYEALIAGGVNNMQAYDCILESVDRSVEFSGYKAVNFIGVVSMASPDTVFASDSELIDAHIDTLAPNVVAAYGLDLFRLAEALYIVVVSARLKAHLESYQFPFLEFRELTELVT